jgi:hypothetical protein
MSIGKTSPDLIKSAISIYPEEYDFRLQVCNPESSGMGDALSKKLLNL